MLSLEKKMLSTYVIFCRELFRYRIKQHALHTQEKLEQLKNFDIDIQVFLERVDVEGYVCERHGRKLVFGRQVHDVDRDVEITQPFVD